MSDQKLTQLSAATSVSASDLIYIVTNYQQGDPILTGTSQQITVSTLSSALSGTSGTSGTSGINGTSGTSGSSGTSGTSGSNGTSGSSGTSGTTGTSGSSGTTGTSGSSGTTGTSGSSGTNGVSGLGFSAQTVGQSFVTDCSLVGSNINFYVADYGAFAVGNFINIVDQTSGSTFYYTGRITLIQFAGGFGWAIHMDVLGCGGTPISSPSSSWLMELTGSAGTNGSSGTSGTSGTGFNTVQDPEISRILTSDGTSNGAIAEPGITYNSNTGKAGITGSLSVTADTGNVEFSYLNVVPAVWSAGGGLITARCRLAGAGTQNAGLAFGGSSPTISSCTEEYNGSSWSAGGALITARAFLAGAGEQNAALAFGGNSPALSCTEEYDGTSWSTGGALSTARYTLAGAGTQDAGLAIGGSTASPTFITLSCTEEYNGSTWSAGGALITARCNLAGSGTQNAGLAFGGYDGGFATVSCTEEYNGSSWTAGGALITGRSQLAGAGTQNAGLAFGGSSPTISSCTEEYNGSSWTAGAGLITARRLLAGAGTQNSGLAFGGANPSQVSCTEEYIGASSTNTKTFEYSCSNGGLSLTGTTILSGNTTMVGNLNVSGTTTGTFVGDGSGLTGVTANPFPYSGTAQINGGLQVTGQTSMVGPLTLSGGNVEFSYSAPIGPNAWSTGGALITARYGLAGAGTQNAGLAIGGRLGSPFAVSTCTEEYDGSSWSAGGALSTARCDLAGAGTQNAGLAFGGLSPSNVSCTEEYDGSSWSAGGVLITARWGLAGAGTQNAGLAFGGSFPTLPFVASCTEEYNGTSWTAGGALITARDYLAGSGTQNAGLAFGGYAPGGSCTEEYDGTSWSTGGALITARCRLAGSGTQNAGLAFGGIASPSVRSCTEEYNGTSWSAGGALSTARCLLGGAGTQNAGLAFGGAASDIVSCTEEYSPTLVNTKTFEYSCTTGGLGLTGTTIFSGNTTIGGDLNVSGTTKLLTVQSGSSSSQVLVYNTSTNTVERRSDAEWISGGTINGVGWSATTTSPTVGTFSRNVISYKQIGPKEWEVNIVYEQSSGGSGGSGDYIFTLPNNLSFNTTIPSQQIYQSGVTSNSWANGQDALAASGIITDLTIGSQVYPVIWTATTFRIFAPYPTTSNLRFWGSSFYGLTGIINMKFSFIST